MYSYQYMTMVQVTGVSLYVIYTGSALSVSFL